ncbi:MAG: DUF47 family protein [Candidatus Nezhaarchaeota archaeon]|nr:DUF47 family protein [Candidatus Nezhaarchaeota archaeon]
MAAWIWASKRVEKSFVSKCSEHEAKVLEVVQGLIAIIQLIRVGDVYQARLKFNDVMKAECEADEIKRNTIYLLSKTTLLPLDRDYILRLVLRIDDIADYSKAAARRLLLAVKVGISFDPDYLSALLDMALKLQEAVKLVDQALTSLGNNLEKSLHIADKIERLEEEVDEIRTNLLEFVLSKCDERGPKWCAIAKEIVDELENSMDKCEDAADMIRYIAVGIS